jgi:2-polyprenyl-6-methoxyphenol hydroxylase-like FAD-dependent oxidoreductase
VGGGPTGLFMAHMLQSYNIPFLLLEAQTPEERFQHPQAHFLNTRTMEILKYSLGNDIYSQIRSAMPPVEEWKSFFFGPTMTADVLSTSKATAPMMAQVVHPVDHPLIANTDANGKLQPFGVADVRPDRKTHDESPSTLPLSELSVGHLAQHKFCRILHESLVKRNEGVSINNETDKGTNSILYGTRVTGCKWDDVTGLWHIQTSGGDSIQSSIVVAADGARSMLRSDVLKIPMNGQPTIQHLINVHFQVSAETESRIPPAMLYTIFHPHVLAMVVRHGPGDYVMQIPYFHPYQTPEHDFSEAKVSKMVHAALGGGVNTDHTNIEFTIQSIRPWTMGSLVAEEYFSEKGIFLVGDAAHIFPPAGGFGMNTGLQDVYSLAWRLALLKRERQQPAEQESSHLENYAARTGQLYQQERQQVARENAALSVRNYRRVLGVMEACYLNHKHPTTLIAALDASSTFVPFKIRQQTFQTLLKTALSPFSQLLSSPEGIYARHITNNLRTLLESGQGLPLLFPKHELDFSYPTARSSNRIADMGDAADWTQDSWSSSPRLAVGALFPHFTAYLSSETAKDFPSLTPVTCLNHDNGTTAQRSHWISQISTRDLAAQLATPERPVVFCILEVQRTGTSSSNKASGEMGLITLARRFQDSVKVPCIPVRMIVNQNPPEAVATKESIFQRGEDGIVTIVVSETQWGSLKLSDDAPVTDEGNCMVVIRPDGHVAYIGLGNAHPDLVIEDGKKSIL